MSLCNNCIDSVERTLYNGDTITHKCYYLVTGDDEKQKF